MNLVAFTCTFLVTKSHFCFYVNQFCIFRNFFFSNIFSQTSLVVTQSHKMLQRADTCGKLFEFSHFHNNASRVTFLLASRWLLLFYIQIANINSACCFCLHFAFLFLSNCALSYYLCTLLFLFFFMKQHAQIFTQTLFLLFGISKLKFLYWEIFWKFTFDH